MHMRIRDLPPDERPRERLWQAGPAALSAAELLALLLGSGDGQGRNAVSLAQSLLSRYGDGAGSELGRTGLVRPGVLVPGPALAGLGSAAAPDLALTPGIGPAKAARVVAGIELGRRTAAARLDKPAVRSPKDIADLFAERLGRQDREHFYAVLLDTKNQVIAAEHVAVGSVDSQSSQRRPVTE